MKSAHNHRIGITQQSEWDQKWHSIFHHYQQDIRHAYYINAVLHDNERKILEIGAGSFRDMAHLNAMGIDCWGSDYSTSAVELARTYFPNLKDKIIQSDASAMTVFPDKLFDVTFHNGLWVLFNDDHQILDLAKEQHRISRSRMMVTVHNGHNKEFMKYFEQRSREDELYKIRFFEVDEITELMKSVCNSVKVIPVGKGKKFHEDAMINKGEASRNQLRSFFESAGLKHLESSERLLCIGEV